MASIGLILTSVCATAVLFNRVESITILSAGDFDYYNFGILGIFGIRHCNDSIFGKRILSAYPQPHDLDSLMRYYWRFKELCRLQRLATSTTTARTTSTTTTRRTTPPTPSPSPATMKSSSLLTRLLTTSLEVGGLSSPTAPPSAATAIPGISAALSRQSPSTDVSHESTTIASSSSPTILLASLQSSTSRSSLSPSSIPSSQTQSTDVTHISSYPSTDSSPILTSPTPTDSANLTTSCSGECECFAYCSHKNLTELPEHLERFTENSIEYNNIKNLSLAKTSAPHRAYSLDLSFNHVTDIPATTFANFHNLHYLNLSHNNISGIASGAFQHLEVLGFLGLNDNNISHISSRMFAASDSQTRPRLRMLHLSNNRLETLPRELLRTFPNLETISLAGNPWRCDRKLLFLSDAMAKSKNMFADRDEVTCATPLELKGMKVADLDTEVFSRLTTEFTQTTLAQSEMTTQGKSSFPSASDSQETRQQSLHTGTERETSRAANQQETTQDKSSLSSQPTSQLYTAESVSGSGSGYLPSQPTSQLHTVDSESGSQSGYLPSQPTSQLYTVDSESGSQSGYLPSQPTSQLYTVDSESGSQSGYLPSQPTSQLHTAESGSGSGSRPMSTEHTTTQATFYTPSPFVRVEESKAPPSEGRSNAKTIIIGVSAGVLGLVLTVVVLAAVVRNVRRWKRMYRLDTHNRVLEASIDYRHLNNSSSTLDTEARITIFKTSEVGEGNNADVDGRPLLEQTSDGITLLDI